MTLIKITADDPEDLFKAPEFPVLPAGTHLFLVANQMEIIDSSGGIPMIKLEARCQDDGEGKGMVVFDNFMLYTSETANTEKLLMAKKINDAALAQYVCACGLLTVDEMKASKEFDIVDLNGRSFNAVTVVRGEKIYPEELDDLGKPKTAPRASIKKYLVTEEASEGDSAAEPTT